MKSEIDFISDFLKRKLYLNTEYIILTLLLQKAKSIERHLKALEEIFKEDEFKDEMFLKKVERGVLHDIIE